MQTWYGCHGNLVQTADIKHYHANAVSETAALLDSLVTMAQTVMLHLCIGGRVLLGWSTKTAAAGALNARCNADLGVMHCIAAGAGCYKHHRITVCRYLTRFSSIQAVHTFLTALQHAGQ